MHIAVRWESSYLYSEAVRLLHTELRVIPADGFGQRRREAELTLTPRAQPQQLSDAFGNEYHHVDFIEEIDHIHVALRAAVETEQPVEPDEPSPLMRHLYLSPTVRSPFEPAVTELCEGIPRELDPAATGAALSSLLHGRFGFRVGSTDVGSTALDLLNVGHGVCQDFTHLMLAALRMRGHSGPLRERLPRSPRRRGGGAGQPRLGAAAGARWLAWLRSRQPLSPGRPLCSHSRGPRLR